MKKTQESVTSGGSVISRYQDVVIGQRSIWTFIYYEWCMLLSLLPGAIGLFLRKIFWPKLFRDCGKGVVFGANVIVRHPHRIIIGDRVIISEGCILDARNSNTEKVINIDDDVILSNNVMLSSKNGYIEIGARTGINASTIIQSINNNRVAIDADVIIGPQCFIVGGSNYNYERIDIPIWKQGIKFDGGITIKENVWIAAKATILGGVTLGEGSIIAAGSVVNKPVPVNVVCGGIPAKIIKKRENNSSRKQQ